MDPLVFSTSTKPRRRNRFTFWLLLLVLVALALLSVLGSTLAKANQIMRQPAKPLEPFAINILPRYEPVQFRALDDQTRLSGWLMKPSTEVRGTIVMVHDQGENRLQFGLDSADLFQFLTDQGFQVLAFDLRASGESGGDLASFGYMEADDVLAALAYVKPRTPNGRLLLMAFGTGTAASLSAYQKLLPLTGGERPADKTLAELELWREDIAGLLLDSPAATAADYIRARIAGSESFLSRYVYPITLPIGVRFSGGNRAEIRESDILSLVLCPVWLTRNRPDTYLPNEVSDQLMQERLRRFPTTTRVYETQITGHLSGYLLNRDGYFNELENFFDAWFARP